MDPDAFYSRLSDSSSSVIGPPESMGGSMLHPSSGALFVETFPWASSPSNHPFKLFRLYFKVIVFFQGFLFV